VATPLSASSAPAPLKIKKSYLRLSAPICAIRVSAVIRVIRGNAVKNKKVLSALICAHLSHLWQRRYLRYPRQRRYPRYLRQRR